MEVSVRFSGEGCLEAFYEGGRRKAEEKDEGGRMKKKKEQRRRLSVREVFGWMAG
jgi:hypothetical protein